MRVDFGLHSKPLKGFQKGGINNNANIDGKRRRKIVAHDSQNIKIKPTNHN